MRRERVSGKALQKAIVAEARRQGWLVAHFYAAQTVNRGWVTTVAADGKGFPDLFMLRERPLMIEVKGDGDRVRPDQLRWKQAAALAGVQFVVATPKLWADGALDDVLRATSYEEADDGV